MKLLCETSIFLLLPYTKTRTIGGERWVQYYLKKKKEKVSPNWPKTDIVQLQSFNVFN